MRGILEDRRERKIRKNVAKTKSLLRRTKGYLEQREQDLCGESVGCNSLAGSGFVLVATPEPARDIRRNGSLEVPSFLRSAKRLDIAEVGRAQA